MIRLLLKVVFLLSPILFSTLAEAVSLGEAVGNVYSTTSFVVRLMWAACVITGIALLFTAITQYQIHRNNPKLVPLTTPITYIILGLCTLAIPFAERIFGIEDAKVKNSKVRGVPTTIKKVKKKVIIRKVTPQQASPQQSPQSSQQQDQRKSR